MIDIVLHVQSLAIFTRRGKTSLRQSRVDWPRSDAKDYAEPITAKLRESADVQRPLGIFACSAYSKHYQISEQDLLWVAGCAEELGRAVHAICSERIAELQARCAST